MRYINIIVISILFTLILIKLAYSTDEINTQIFGNSFTNSSGITQNYIGPINNPWLFDHNIGLFIFDNTSSDSTDFYNYNYLNTSASFSGNIGGRTGIGYFLNISNWNGYFWGNPPNLNSTVINNNNISTTLNLNSVNVTDSGGMNFFNFSVYFPYVVNSTFVNNESINNVFNITSSNNINNVYNYAVYSEEPGNFRTELGNVSFSNFGNINNNLAVLNTNFNGGLYNYVFNIYGPNKSFSANYLNDANLFSNINLQSVSATEIRNQVLVALGSNLNKINNINIFNNSNVIASMNLVNTNTGLNDRISNDGIIVLYANNANVNNNGNVIVNTYFDDLSSGLESSSGIFYYDVDQGSISNNGLIRIRNNVANGFNSAGINLFNSGSVNPIVINTPVLMDLDNNVRNIILYNSSARLDSFGWYVDGDPNTLLRPILIDNNSILNLNNTNLHLWVGSNIYLNTPYYIVENIGSNISGSFNNNIIRNFALNPDIELSWYNNTDNPAIIFSMNKNLNPIENFYLISNSNIYFIYRNYNEYLRNYLINNYNLNLETYNFIDKENNNRLKLRSFSYYEYFDGRNIDGELLARGLVFDRYLNKNSKLGFILGNLNYSQKQELNIYKNRNRGFIYGIYLILNNENNYLFFDYINSNIKVKYDGLTGVNYSVLENSKYNINLNSSTLEYGIKKDNKNLLLGLNYNRISNINYITQSQNNLFDRNVSISSKGLSELYVGIDFRDFDKDNQNEFYYLTFRIGYLISDNKININETLQNDNRVLTYEIPRLNLKTGFYFNLKKFLLSFNAEFNRDYRKYGIMISRRF
mgnify:CR=1 FL=1